MLQKYSEVDWLGQSLGERVASKDRLSLDDYIYLLHSTRGSAAHTINLLGVEKSALRTFLRREKRLIKDLESHLLQNAANTTPYSKSYLPENLTQRHKELRWVSHNTPIDVFAIKNQWDITRLKSSINPESSNINNSDLNIFFSVKQANLGANSGLNYFNSLQKESNKSKSLNSSNNAQKDIDFRFSELKHFNSAEMTALFNLRNTMFSNELASNNILMSPLPLSAGSVRAHPANARHSTNSGLSLSHELPFALFIEDTFATSSNLSLVDFDNRVNYDNNSEYYNILNNENLDDLLHLTLSESNIRGENRNLLLRPTAFKNLSSIKLKKF
jgi:hypothetical protein